MTETRTPLVSVVIPSYNHERFIGEAIESVLAQSVNDFEMIVVDDGSSDNSVKVVEKFHDNRIKLFTQDNHGAHQALNNGIEHASSPWIAILNSDDRFRSDKLEKHLALHARNPDLEASASRVRYITESGDPAKRDGYLAARYEEYKQISGQHESLFVSLLRVNHLISTSSLFLKHETFESIGGFIPLRYVHDWFMFLTLAQRGHLHIIEEELTDYRRHGKNTIVQNDEMGKIEDNFVIEWQLFQALNKTNKPPISMNDALCMLSENRRINFRLFFLFQIWRQLNNNNLENAARIFSEKDNAVVEQALELLRRDRSLRDVFTEFKRTLGYRYPAVADFLTRAKHILQRLLQRRWA